MAYFDCNFDIDLGLSFDQAKSKTQEEFKTELLDSFESKKGDFLEYIKGLGGQGDAIAYSSISFSSTYANWSFGIQGIDDFSLYGNFVFTSGEKLTSYCAGHWNLSYQGNGLPPLVVDFLQGDEVTISEIEEGSVDISLPPSDEQIASQNLATAQAQQAQYMDWLNNSAYIANLRTQMNLDSNFYFVEDHGITDNEFWYTFETGYYTETGVTNVQETQPFTPSDTGGTTVSGEVTVNWGTPPTLSLDTTDLDNKNVMFSMSQADKDWLSGGNAKMSLDTTNAKVELDTTDKTVQLDWDDTKSIAVNVPDGTRLSIDEITGTVTLDTEGKYVSVTTDGVQLAVAVEEGTEIALDTSGKSVNLNTSDKFVSLDTTGKSIDLDSTGKTVELDTTNKNIPLDTTDKTVELDVANKNVALDTSDASVKLDGTSAEGEEDTPFEKMVSELKTANSKRDSMINQGQLRNNSEYGYTDSSGEFIEGARTLEKAVAEYQKSVDESTTAEGKDRKSREIESYEQQFNNEVDIDGMAKGHFGRLKNSGYYVDKTISLHNGLLEYESKGVSVEGVTYDFAFLKGLNEQFGFITDYDSSAYSLFDVIAEVYKKSVSNNVANSKPETE